MNWTFDSATELGGRHEQQDRSLVLPIPDRRNTFIAILADGVGGQEHGALAAEAVIETAQQTLSPAAGDEPRRFLSNLCHQADSTIKHLGQTRACTPASTCVALLVRDEEAYWVSVGDSRLYHFEAGRLLSRTKDHTVAERFDPGGDSSTTPAPVQGDKRLTMCLGGKNALEPEFGVSAVGPKDWFVLCSDGFWNQAEPERLASELGSMDTAPTAAELARQAVDRTGTSSDNVSLLIARPADTTHDCWWRRLLPGSR